MDFRNWNLLHTKNCFWIWFLFLKCFNQLIIFPSHGVRAVWGGGSIWNTELPAVEAEGAEFTHWAEMAPQPHGSIIRCRKYPPLYFNCHRTISLLKIPWSASSIAIHVSFILFSESVNTWGQMRIKRALMTLEESCWFHLWGAALLKERQHHTKPLLKSKEENWLVKAQAAGPQPQAADSLLLGWGPQNLHFWQIPRWCWCCWCREHT